jgi:transposase
VFNPRYLDFARHHGFAIEACNVARGNEKGRVESGVGYVKKNFVEAAKLELMANFDLISWPIGPVPGRTENRPQTAQRQ